MRRVKLTIVLLAIILSLAACALAQSPAPSTLTTTPIPPTATAPPTPAATLTPPPAMLVIEATPIPQPQAGLLSEFWKQYKYAVIMALVATLLIGVLLVRIIEKLADWGGKALDWLARRFANWAYFCRRNWRRYVATLNAETEAWQSLHGTELRMEDIYVAVQLTDLPAMYTRADAAANGAPTRKPRRRDRRLEPRQAVADLRRVAVVGEPGAGKTTLLRWLAWLYANERAEAPSPPAWLSRPFPRRGRLETQAGDHTSLPRWLSWLTPIGRVPVLIPLKELQDVEDLADYLPTYFKDHDWPDAHDFISETLDKGMFLFLFDALDEVDDPAKLPPLVDMVNDFATRHSNEEHPNWIVLSSRPQSYQACAMQLPTFKTVEMLEFEPQQIRDFLANWFRADPSLTEKLWSQLAADDRLMELAANPLLLTFITEAYEQVLSLETRRRAGLFGEIVTVRMEEWDRKRGVRRDFQFMRPQKEGYLRGTALRLNAQTRSLIPRSELLEGVRAYLLADGRVDPDAPDPPHNRTQADRFLWEIAEGSGLLHEKAIAHYDFSHKTLREYFAAAELRELPDGETRLLRHLQTGSFDRWGMVAVLYAGLCHDASSFIRALSQRNPALTTDGLLLAAYCLRDAASVAADPALRDDLSTALVTALPDADPAVQDEAIHVLRALHQARPGQLEAHARRVAGVGHPTLAVRLLPDAPEAEGLRAELSRVFLDDLQTGDAETREAAMAAMAVVGGAPEAAAPLLRDLEADDPGLRAEAARTLAALAVPDPAVLQALHARHQADPDSDVRAASLLALLRLGEADSLGMVHVPAGEFLMGTPLEQARQLAAEFGYGETDLDRETPQHTVQLPDYYIQKTPVTNAQYQAFLDANGDYRVPHRDIDWARPYNWDPEKRVYPQGLADHPVVLVSWEDAAAYARWAGVRLPTEAEWEKAARGGLQIGSGDNPYPDRLWPWGNEWGPDRCNSAETWARRPLKTLGEWRNWWESEWRKEFEGKQVQTTPVGRYATGASPYGALDLAGNVWEWTADWYQGYPGTTYKSDDFGQKYRVLRGGSWRIIRVIARVAFRYRFEPDNINNLIGFRCASGLP